MKKSIIFSILVLVLVSCNCNKKTVAVETKKLENGFKKAIVYKTNLEPCSYKLQVNEIFYDPINLTENFKKDKLKVWVKFNGLRMKNRCSNLQPINIQEVEIRE